MPDSAILAVMEPSVKLRSGTPRAETDWAERIGALALRNLARFPLRLRRPLLRLAWRATLPFRKNVGFGAGPLLSRSLRVGRRDGERIARDLDFEDFLQTMEWYASTLQSQAGMKSDWRSARVEDPDLMERLAATGEPVVLAPIHMGSYALGIAYVLHRFFRGRRVLILRAREDNALDVAGMARVREIASELRILNTNNEADFLDAMRFARKGAVVICLFDLPPSYGTPADVSLFGAPARIAFGLDAMARMLKAVVLPIAVESRLSGDVVRCGQAFEVAHPSERPALAVAMAAQIERFVYANPGQWQMWTRLNEFRPQEQ